MSKNKIFNLVLLSLILIFFYLMYGLYGIYDIKKNKNLLFLSKKNFEFHKRYSKKLHHLRDTNRWGKNDNEYLFSFITQNKNPIRTILFQGDSWIESISEINSSKKLINEFGKKNNFNIINAGITSYAPSPMHIQYQILKEDFQIKPDILVVYIDQTDLGDEYCRYKHNKVYSSDGIFLRIKNENFNKAIYDYTKIYEYSYLKFKGKGAIILQYPVIKIRYFLKRNFNQLNHILNFGYSQRNIRECSFKYIQKELIEKNEESIKNFKISLDEYLKYLENETYIKKILIVSFPHKNHYKKIYKINISNLIDDHLQISRDERISHLNMSKIFSSIDSPDRIYKKDLASHLKDEFHTNIFLKKILEKLDN